VELRDLPVLPLGAPIPDGVMDTGISPPMAKVRELLATGGPVLVSLDGEQAALLAAASVYAWLGVQVFRVPAEHVAAVGQVLDMVASIKGIRQPTLSRRGLA
jgi:dihydropteroate synthase